MGRCQERQATRVSWASRTNNAAVATHTHSKPCIIEVQIAHHIFWVPRFKDVPYIVPILILFFAKKMLPALSCFFLLQIKAVAQVTSFILAQNDYTDVYEGCYQGCSKFFHLENVIFAKKKFFRRTFANSMFFFRGTCWPRFLRKTWMCDNLKLFQASDPSSHFILRQLHLNIYVLH